MFQSFLIISADVPVYIDQYTDLLIETAYPKEIPTKSWLKGNDTKVAPPLNLIEITIAIARCTYHKIIYMNVPTYFLALHDYQCSFTTPL